MYIIVVNLLQDRFLIFEKAALPYVIKISQKWTAFVFGSTYLHLKFTKCVSNQYTYFDISTWQIRLQVIERPLILLCFLDIFSYIIIGHYGLNYCISTKLSPIICLINTHIYMYVNILDVTASYGMHIDLIEFFRNFAHNWRIFMPVGLYLHQTFSNNCIFHVI